MIIYVEHCSRTLRNEVEARYENINNCKWYINGIDFEFLHERFCLQGLWRGDPCRPVTVVDTPGLGGEDGRDDEVW